MVFYTSPNAASMSDVIAKQLSQMAPNAAIIGCSAESVLGVRQEIENETVASVLVIAGLQSVPRCFHVEYQPTADGPSIFGLPDELIESPHLQTADGTGLVLFADPFAFPMDLLIQRVAEEVPGLPILGGYASGASRPGDCGLLLNKTGNRIGAVGMLLPPELKLVPIVSQGCRPIGKPMVVTKVEENVLLTLSGKPALLQLRELYETSPTRDQELLLKSLLIGRAIHEYHDQLDHGQFVVRQCLGVDDTQNGVVVSEPIRLGQTVQFHVRDSETASADLQATLKQAKDLGVYPIAALMFTCNGRGSRMFAQPDHDAKTFDHYFPNLPLAGFFAAGEFGPIGKQSFLHGFTASIALLCIA